MCPLIESQPLLVPIDQQVVMKEVELPSLGRTRLGQQELIGDSTCLMEIDGYVVGEGDLRAARLCEHRGAPR